MREIIIKDLKKGFHQLKSSILGDKIYKIMTMLTTF